MLNLVIKTKKHIRREFNMFVKSFERNFRIIKKSDILRTMGRSLAVVDGKSGRLD